MHRWTRAVARQQVHLARCTILTLLALVIHPSHYEQLVCNGTRVAATNAPSGAAATCSVYQVEASVIMPNAFEMLTVATDAAGVWERNSQL